MAIKTYEKLNIIDAIKETGNFNTLLEYLDMAGLTDDLSSMESSFTFFAPTDEAFSELDPEIVRELTTTPDKQRLADTLRFHTASGKISSEDLIKSDHLTSLLGEKIEILQRNGSIIIEDAEIITRDVCASNGIIHIIDKVLIPKSIVL